MSKRLERFKELGLLGCLNGTGVTSTNYKESLCKMEWISVKDGLPKEGDIVVVWLMDIEEPACVRFEIDEYGAIWNELMEIDRCNNSRESRVSHWMPLPQSPKI